MLGAIPSICSCSSVEAQRPREQRLHDQQRPAVADRRERLGKRRLLVDALPDSMDRS